MAAMLQDLRESFGLDRPTISTRQASVGRRTISSNFWLTGLVLTAVVAIGIILGSWRSSAVARSPRPSSAMSMCPESRIIDSLVSSGTVYAPGQNFAYKLLDNDGGAVEMVFEAMQDHPWIKATASMHNGFGMFTNQATATRLRISFRSPENQEPLKLPYFAISFVQLVDTSFHSHKHVKVLGNWTDAILAQDSTVLLQHQGDEGNWISFHAGKTDSHQPTPSSPATLTLDQLKEAATLRFVDLESFQIHIDVGVHEMHGFLFSTTAALLCAEVSHVDNPQVEFVTNPRVFELSDEASESAHVVRAANRSLFQQWYVKQGDYIHAGDALFQVTSLLGLQDVRSEVAGRVSHLQSLLPGDYLEAGAPMMVIDTAAIDWVFVGAISVAAIAAIGLIICIWRSCCRKSTPDPDPDDPEKPESIPVTILEFETPSGWKQIAEWKHQPLGLGFYETTSPPRVAYVGKDAMSMGIKKGDSLVGVGDQVSGMMKTDGKAFDSVWRELKTRAERLPFVPRLVLRFERAGRYQDFEWRTKPLGLVFSESMPMTVTEVHEEAEHLGVRVGDVLSGYGRETHLLKRVEGKSAEDIQKALHERVADFPTAPSLVMVFELPDNSTKEFYWKSHPLGIEIGTSLPIVVEKVTSERAKTMGIEVGFVLKSFGDSWRRLEVADGKEAELIILDLERFIDKLPTRS